MQKTNTKSTPTAAAVPTRKVGANGRYHRDDDSRYAVTIAAATAEVFAFFRDFSNFPKFMKDLEEVRVLTNKRSHWKVKLKNGLTAEWDAEITSERPGEMISWKSDEGSEVMTTGSVWFSPAPAGKGTIVSLSMSYQLPGGAIAELLTKITGEDPDTLTHLNLKRFKALMETGEIATIEGQPSGRDEDAQKIVTH